MKNLALLLIPAFLVGCADACEKAADRTLAFYEGCGVDLPEGSGDAEAAECTDEAAALADCAQGCLDAAGCGIIDGSDTDYTGEAWTTYGECATACTAA